MTTETGHFAPGVGQEVKTLRRIDAQGLYLLKNEFRELQDIEHPNLVSLSESGTTPRGGWFDEDPSKGSIVRRALSGRLR